MAINNPNDPRQATPVDDFNRRPPYDSKLQIDPELTEGPASGSRIAIYAVAVLAMLAVVFYGLNNSAPRDTASNPPATSTTADSSRPMPPVVRDVTPNRESGTTTGAAPAQQAQPSQASPQGIQNNGQPKQ